MQGAGRQDEHVRSVPQSQASPKPSFAQSDLEFGLPRDGAQVEPERRVSVFVRELSGQTLCLQVDLAMTPDLFYSLVSGKTGIPLELLCLYHHGRPLSNFSSLRAAAIMHSDTIYVGVKVKAGYPPKDTMRETGSSNNIYDLQRKINELERFGICAKEKLSLTQEKIRMQIEKNAEARHEDSKEVMSQVVFIIERYLNIPLFGVFTNLKIEKLLKDPQMKQAFVGCSGVEACLQMIGPLKHSGSILGSHHEPRENQLLTKQAAEEASAPWAKALAFLTHVLSKETFAEVWGKFLRAYEQAGSDRWDLISRKLQQESLNLGPIPCSSIAPILSPLASCLMRVLCIPELDHTPLLILLGLPEVEEFKELAKFCDLNAITKYLGGVDRIKDVLERISTIIPIFSSSDDGDEFAVNEKKCWGYARYVSLLVACLFNKDYKPSKDDDCIIGKEHIISTHPELHISSGYRAKYFTGVIKDVNHKPFKSKKLLGENFKYNECPDDGYGWEDCPDNGDGIWRCEHFDRCSGCNANVLLPDWDGKVVDVEMPNVMTTGILCSVYKEISRTVREKVLPFFKTIRRPKRRKRDEHGKGIPEEKTEPPIHRDVARQNLDACLKCYKAVSFCLSCFPGLGIRPEVACAEYYGLFNCVVESTIGALRNIDDLLAWEDDLGGNLTGSGILETQAIHHIPSMLQLVHEVASFYPQNDPLRYKPLYEQWVEILTRFSDVINAYCKRCIMFLSSTDKYCCSGSLSFISEFPHILNWKNKERYMNTILPDPESFDYDEKFTISVNRDAVLDDSLNGIMVDEVDLTQKSLEVTFQNEMGEGRGVTRAWFTVVAEKLFDPNNGLFSPCGHNQRLMIPSVNSQLNDETTKYLEFAGRFIALSILHRVKLGVALPPHLFKFVCGREDIDYKEDMKYVDAEEYELYEKLRTTEVSPDYGLTFACPKGSLLDEPNGLGFIELCKGGNNIIVTDRNKLDYIAQKSEYLLMRRVKAQLIAFKKGVHHVINKFPEVFKFFQPHDFQNFMIGKISIDIAQWKSWTIYRGYTEQSQCICWFWTFVESLNQHDRQKMLFFATSINVLPISGFPGLVRKMLIVRDDNPRNLPTAQTCFYQLTLPKYRSYEDLRTKCELALSNAGRGFQIL